MRRYTEEKNIGMLTGIPSPTVRGFGTGPDEVIRNRE